MWVSINEFPRLTAILCPSLIVGYFLCPSQFEAGWCSVILACIYHMNASYVLSHSIAKKKWPYPCPMVSMSLRWCLNQWSKWADEQKWCAHCAPSSRSCMLWSERSCTYDFSFEISRENDEIIQMRRMMGCWSRKDLFCTPPIPLLFHPR